MNPRLLSLLCCPRCRNDLDLHVHERTEGMILSGTLQCRGCEQRYAVTNGIPRFVPPDNYASTFGYQWNRFRLEQIDSSNGTRLSERRFRTETEWSEDWLAGKWILDAGCGAGRFLEVASRAQCDVVGVDITSAIDAARATLGSRPNVHFVQASIFELPFRDGAFDACYCIGVIQHTPDPQRALSALPRVVRVGGRVAVTIYERRRFTLLCGKYLIRPITRRMNRRALLLAIRLAMPVLFPLTEVLFRLPVLGRLFRFAIPVSNYVEEKELTVRQRYQWAVLDTFDALSPWYDRPQTHDEATRALEGAGLVDIRRVSSTGVNLEGQRA